MHPIPSIFVCSRYCAGASSKLLVVTGLEHSAECLDGRINGDVTAGDGSGGVDLANLPVGVLPGLVLAVELELDTTLGRDATAFLEAVPGLVDAQVVAGAVKGEGGLVVVDRNVAVVDEVAVVEVRELVGGGAADRLVLQHWVGEGEVDVAPGVLVGGGGEGVAGVEVEVLNLPLADLGRLGHTGLRLGLGSLGGRGRQGQRRAGEQEDGGDDAEAAHDGL